MLAFSTTVHLSQAAQLSAAEHRRVPAVGGGGLAAYGAGGGRDGLWLRGVQGSAVSCAPTRALRGLCKGCRPKQLLPRAHNLWSTLQAAFLAEDSADHLH